MPIVPVADHFASFGFQTMLQPNDQQPGTDCVTWIVNKRFSKGLFVYLMFTIRSDNAA